uniref:Leucine-rich repeats and guanylate kinase domain containing n=1 Tax=Sinocyclocheilus rhinocerous TaxID=307959 RepID=A0A673H4S4_9TELE
LCNYIYLQKLELPYNKIKDLSCVSHMPHLIILDASHNQLTDFFGFQMPNKSNLVDFYNSFSAIRGLEKCKRLSHLSLAHNKISRIRGLDHLSLRTLCLRGNVIQKIENLQTLRNLQVLDLSCNRIQSLSGLQNLHFLGNINLESNLVKELSNSCHIILLVSPIPVFHFQVSAVNKYDPPLEVIAARDHMTHLMYQLMQPQVIFDSTLPSLDAPYPILVLTGPQACGKRELAHKLCQEFSDYFAYGACHTTRGPYYGEEDGSDYHFVTEEEFQNMIQMGQFVQTMQYGGHWYGLSRETIERVAREGLACCVHMELEGVYSLKNSYFEPRYVLLIPTVVDTYVCFLKARGFYSNAQMETAVSRIDLYAKINRESPGFFDNIIPCQLRCLLSSVLSAGHFDRIIKNIVVNSCTQCEAMAFHCCSHSRHLFTMAECPYYNSVIDSTVELLAANTTEATDLMDSYSRNYQNKIQAKMTPQQTPAVSQSY